MIRSPLGLRLDPTEDLKSQFRLAAQLGAQGVVIDAVGDLGPDRLSETGRREFRHALRSVQLSLIALHLPTRRPFDTVDELDLRLNRAERAFELAYDLGAPLVLARVGAIPPESDPSRRAIFSNALVDLGRRADHRGVRFAIETGTDRGTDLNALLVKLSEPALVASIDPASLLRQGIDPVATTASVGARVAHAYANDASTGAGTSRIVNPRGQGYPPGALDWEEYLGALEEINYRGFLTMWPDFDRDISSQVKAITERLARF